MKKVLMAVSISVLLTAGCMVGYVEHRGAEVEVVPVLPAIVAVDAGHDYYQHGWYYRLDGKVWYYSKSWRGPWAELPRTHYPREIRRRHMGL